MFLPHADHADHTIFWLSPTLCATVRTDGCTLCEFANTRDAQYSEAWVLTASQYGGVGFEPDDSCWGENPDIDLSTVEGDPAFAAFVHWLAHHAATGTPRLDQTVLDLAASVGESSATPESEPSNGYRMDLIGPDTLPYYGRLLREDRARLEAVATEAYDTQVRLLQRLRQ